MSEPQPMPPERPELRVLDVPDLERFEARLGRERALAGLIDYRLADDYIVLTHTEVLDGFEGQGIGSRLVRAVLEDLRERDVAVIPKCPFIVAWLKKHPEQHDVLFRPLEAPEPDEPSPA
ncbi:MAG: GNAT family N-acetyltransferase [Candidatus Limnocylindrales bacterium]